MTTFPEQSSPDVGTSGSENCLPVGARIAEFEITGIVGEGGFGIVYLAFDHSLQRIVALKEYMPGVMAGRGTDQSVVVRSKRHEEAFATGLRSFINEARLLAQFDNPALIKIHRYWEQNNTGYMAMRYYEGRTVRRILQDEPAVATQAWLTVMLQSILEALEALYRVQVLHRDISPENIMIQSNGEAVLLDFGAARQIISDMTQALTVILKPGYAPIEQYADDPSMLQGPWTDIYSLSAVMYVAITGKSPPSSVARMIQDPIEILADAGYPGFSRNFLDAIDRGLSVKPEHRPQSIPAFRALLGIEERPQQPSRTVHEGAAPGALNTHGSERKGPVSQLPTTGAKGQASLRPTTGSPAHSGAATGGNTGGVQAVLTQSPASRTGSVEDGSTSSNASASASDPGFASGPATGAVAPRRSPKIMAGIALIVLLAGVGYFTFDTRSDSSAAAPPGTASTATVAGGPSTPGEQVVDEETLAWEMLNQRPGLTAAQVSSFIAAHPKGKLLDQAKAKLAELQTRESGAGDLAGKSASILPGTDAAGNVTAEAGTGVILLSIRPWGNVIVDGVPSGVSPPLRKLTLAEGKHDIRVVNPNFPDHVQTIEVSRKKNAVLTVDFAPAE